MAEKEERILITKCSSHCYALRVTCDSFDDNDSMYCNKSGKWVRITEKDCAKCKDPVLLGLSRSEVIERMAKAAKKAYRGYFYTEPHHPNISDIMEAALNSLLEDKK